MFHGIADLVSPLHQKFVYIMESDINVDFNVSYDNVTSNGSDGLFVAIGSSPDTLAGDLNLAKAIPMTIVYSLIFITGIFGNLCTCAVIARNKHMHTATNYYLFSLAMSDLLLLVLGLPQEVFQLWLPIPYLFGEAFCVVRGLAAETSTNASILTITAFTMERYLAICHPLRAHTMSKLSRAVKLVVVIWVVGAVCAVPQAIQFGVVAQRDRRGNIIPHTEDCSLKMPLANAFELSTLVFFLLPMSLITVLYILIGLRLRDHVFRVTSSGKDGGGGGSVRCQEECPEVTRAGGPSVLTLSNPMPNGRRTLRQENSNQRRHHSTNSRRAVVKMLVAVVVAFFVCWAPFHAQRLMAIYAPSEVEALVVVYEALTYVSGVLYYVSATVNPILYHIMSHKFRSAFRDTLGSCCSRSSTRRRRCSSSLSHKNNNYHSSTVRSRVNTETTLEALLREEMEVPIAAINGQSTKRHHHHHHGRSKDDRGNCTNVNKSDSSSLSTSSSANSSKVNGHQGQPPIDPGLTVDSTAIEMEMDEFLRLDTAANPTPPIDQTSPAAVDVSAEFYVSRC